MSSQWGWMAVGVSKLNENRRLMHSGLGIGIVKHEKLDNYLIF